MIKKLLLIFIAIATVSCSSIKKTQKAINYGNYDDAIAISLKNLKNNKTKKSNQEYVLLLEEAYKKATIKDLEYISFLKKDGNPANLEEIYTTYLNLKNRQEQIKPLLPLTVLSEKRNAEISLTDYTDAILNAKNNLSEHIYTNAKQLITNARNKMDYRVAFNNLNYLNELNPNYKTTNNLIEEAHIKGTDYIYVALKNKTKQVIPKNLEADLLNFDTYQLNNLWTVFNTKNYPELEYDYEMEIIFRDINISPEQIHEKEIFKSKQIIDGWKYEKDSLGKNIKVDVYKTITCTVKEIEQYKTVQVTGIVNYFDLNTKQLIDSYPLTSQFIFENKYGTYKGNKSALDKKYLDLIANKYVPFPSNEQMIFDCGEDLKNKIKDIVITNKFTP
ncbi:hypothetical protein MHL31_04550 [Lutibacter sp. A80]|uniref:hypothetical protein n=1 Tax=Lutibacter sp. A80 TaxID=2918453 RepID=UPI001F07056C|nr:hypothetical protein [Lutibacter sp. A80]UMB61478.1 hypothetical protein MHL31_04550 [Lutibacter sp. A80]